MTGVETRTQDLGLYIGGGWVPSASGERTKVLNPATGEVVGTVARGNAEDVDRAMEVAAAAFAAWRRVPTRERVRLQRRAAELLRARAGEFAQLLTLELGRPLAGARLEIERVANLLEDYAEEALRLRGEVPFINEGGERILVLQEPVGVVAAIAPFNYPINLLAFKLGAALPVGCTVVAKPADDTPLSTLRLAELFTEAGFPPGVFNVITGPGRVLGEAMVAHPTPRKVAFTGSTGAGQRIAEVASHTNKRLTLELGGQCPAILCADADLERAVPAITRHAFANSGQFCYRVNRIYVHEDLYAEFVERLGEAAGQLKVGHGLDAGVDLGPMVNEKIFRTSVEHVRDARAGGARIVTGGERLRGAAYDGGFFFPPTVIADATSDMKIMTEETFGPVVGVMPFTDLEDALRLANDTVYGLAAFAFTRDLAQGLRIAEAFEAGSVWINNIHRSSNLAPFGGYKQSGVGREKGRYGLESYLEYKTVYLSE
ncbi:succinate-semialdehyde dehydrogenase / glutarate-semialdehyde dehydrogenase [Deinococcus reticulitermitis]|uniref:Succinate-semialdehyde dehydrogenase / glutarate-semialdehyde dehydrogenase n=1 Tax=Deinococcus reticulitermitis TaxID=856736 RepID=A0A1H6SAL6_9DEIO|nr:NAD-dependent succinate-semialdehyde dehydrogenase [Deinococcus reticulitermitis]SEI60785.1 succinate-semialdehyde dehydrogenase / glutarate-semialdehyde dehydrogenase [Deinococcus reticulitermitis]